MAAETKYDPITENAILAEFYEREFKLVRQEADGHDPVRNNYLLTTFVSRSAGRGRPRRSPREVELVVDLNSGQAYLLKDFPTSPLDTIAQALLGDQPSIDDPFAEFVRRLRD